MKTTTLIEEKKKESIELIGTSILILLVCTAPLVYRIDLKSIVVLVFIIGLAFYHILLIAGINGLDYVRFKRETEGANEKYGISTKNMWQ